MRALARDCTAASEQGSRAQRTNSLACIHCRLPKPCCMFLACLLLLFGCVRAAFCGLVSSSHLFGTAAARIQYVKAQERCPARGAVEQAKLQQVRRAMQQEFSKWQRGWHGMRRLQSEARNIIGSAMSDVDQLGAKFGRLSAVLQDAPATAAALPTAPKPRQSIRKVEEKPEYEA